MRKLRAVTKVAKDVQDKISALRLALARRLGKQRFELWFGSENDLTIVNGTVRIGLPNLLFQKWVAQQFRDDILAACSEVLGFTPRLEFLSTALSESFPSGEIDQVSNRDLPEGEASGVNGQLGGNREPAPDVINGDKTSGLGASAENNQLVDQGGFNGPGPTAAARLSRLDQLANEPVAPPAAPASVAVDETTSPRLDTDQPVPATNVSLCSDAAIAVEGRTCRPEADSAVGDSSEFLFPAHAPLAASRRASKRSSGRFQDRRMNQSEVSARSVAESPSGRRFVLTLADFVVGPCNQLAYAAAVEVARRPGEISPLFLFGPTSVGKTHLLQAVCEEVRRRHRGLIAVCVSADDFITDSVEALRHGGLPSFRSKFRHVDVLAIDDIQFLIGKKWVQRELVLTIDALLREGKQLLLASDRAADELADFGQEFVARLKSGMSCCLDWPDEQTRQGIVERFCQRLSLALPPDVKQFVAAQINGHAREILGALRRLQAVALTSAESLTPQVAARVLEDLLCVRRRPIRLGDICQAVCDVFGVEPPQIVGPSRARPVVQPRLLAMWLARKHTRAGLSEISRFFGRKSHSAVLTAQQTVQRWLAEDRPICVGSRELPIAEVVRQIERRLLAG